MKYIHTEVSDLQGKTLKDVAYNSHEETITFLLEDGTTYLMHHEQDYCEDVYVESIVGNLSDLIGEEIFLAEEVTNEDVTGRFKRCTWTFYKFATRKGFVDIRWCGVSNGYYSERVDFVQIEEGEEWK